MSKIRDSFVFTLSCAALAMGAASPSHALDGRNPRAEARGAGAREEPVPRDPKRDALERAAQRVDDQITAISAEYDEFLQDPWMGLAVRYFGDAQHASTQLVRGGEPVAAEVSKFHDNLDEFLRALASLREGYRPNTTAQSAELRGIPQPSVKVGNKLAAELEGLKRLANGQEGLREIALVKLDSGSSARDSVEYAQRVLDKIDLILYARGMGQITGGGRRETDEKVQPALRALREGIAQMVDAGGERVLQLDDDREPLADQMARVKKLLDEADKMANIFRNAFSHARERTKLVQEELKRLRQNILKPKALRESSGKQGGEVIGAEGASKD